jgi:subtilisin family serine protease
LRVAARLSIFLVVAGLFTADAIGQRTPPPAPVVVPPSAHPARSVQRILVKLRAPLAHAVETALPLETMALSRSGNGSPRVTQFMAAHSGRALKPLYPDLVKTKKLRGLSDLQMATEIRQRFARRGSRASATFKPPEISRSYVLELDTASSQEVTRIVASLNADPNVEFAEPEHIYTATLTPNDPFFSSTGTWGQGYDDLWGIKKIGSATAWDTDKGDGVIVAVVDTGVDYNHPDLAANMWINTGETPGNGIDDDHNGYIDDVRGWDFTSNTNDPIDHFGHGTHVAGTIAAIGNNGIGVIGIAWHARVMAVKGLNDAGSGDDTTLAPAIIYAAKNGANVINASWGGFGTSQTIEEAIKYVNSLGVVFVAAAGNASIDASNFFPANSPEAITVSASDAFDNFASFSDFGPKIDVSGPGVDVLSLQASGTSLGPVVVPGYCRLSGTSMATPHVTGVAALILSQNPGYSPEQVRQVIRSSATDVGPAGYDLSFGYGRVNAALALAVTNPLEAKITGTQPGTGNLINILGNARGTGFASYTLDYGVSALPTTWTNFVTSNNPASGTLGAFDPTVVPQEGTVTIRLTASNGTGGTFVDRTQLTITFASITSPVASIYLTAASTFKAGATIPVMGTAAPPQLQNFNVEWASGANAISGWLTTGITLTGGGLTPIASGQLATWDTTSITQAGYYTLRLTVTGASFSSQQTTNVYLEPDLPSASWPVLLDQGPYFNSGVMPISKADGTSRLIVASPNFGDTPGALWTLALDGSSQKTALQSFGSFHQPSVADLDGVNGEQIVVADNDRIHVFHQDMSFSTFTPPVTIDFMKAPLSLEDLAGDSQLETIAVGENYNDNHEYLYAWRPDGTLFSNNFPIKLQDQNDLSNWYNHTRFLVGDFRGDGSKEFVIEEGLSGDNANPPSTFTLRLFDADGTPLTWNVPVMTGVPFAMVAADLDGNGKLETILLSNDSPTQASLHVFQPDGTERPGWPFTVPNNSQYPQAFLAVADMNRDGQEEIIFSHETALYLFNSDGTLFSNAWPLQTGILGFGSVVIGDIDGDGFPEIVTTRDDFVTYHDVKVVAIRRDGNIARTWQLTGGDGFLQYAYPMPAIGDFDQDGTTDIAIAYMLAGPTSLPGEVRILRTGAPFSPSENDWPFLLHDRRNTGVLRKGTASTTTAVTLTSGASPSTYGQSLTFTAVTGAGGTPTGVVAFKEGTRTLAGGIALVAGAASYTTSTLPSGAHTITAVYSGDATFAASTSSGLAQMVNSAPLVVTANDKSRPFGVVNPIFDGMITGIVNGDTITAGYSTTATRFSLAGSYPIVPAVDGTALSNYSLTVNNGTLTVTPAAAVTGIQLVSGKPPFQHPALVVTVASGGGAIPTGVITLTENAKTVGVGTLGNNGVVSIDVRQLTLGKHVITANYGGDGNYAPATSDSFTFYRSPRPH